MTQGMPIFLTWSDLALRLGLTVLAGLVIGYDRGEQGKVAGMRTTLLVCLAASVAMIQVNLLLPMAGKPPHSFVTNDLMRLPLGILTGVGFIGGGAILRRDNAVSGVTTAATLWLVTVIGLCFGGGQIWLGLIATAIGLAALSGLKRVEDRLQREHPASLAIDLGPDAPDEAALRHRLEAAGLRIVNSRLSYDRGMGRRRLSFEIRQTRRPYRTATPPFVTALAQEAGIVALEWQTKG
ncbi:MAG: MgtC/SapB family protein [Stellaceae bacterium]